jgi:hypothetical protein
MTDKQATAFLRLVSTYGGYTETPIRIVGETRCRYRIQAIERTKIAGRDRWLSPGATTLVPKHAVKVVNA